MTDLITEFLCTKRLATNTGLSTSFFEKGRVYGYGPPYHKVRGRVLYKKSDVELWLAGWRKVPDADAYIDRLVQHQ